MLSDLLFSINAVFPIILVAAFGFIARKLNIIDDAFVKSGNKFCFRFGFFAMNAVGSRERIVSSAFARKSGCRRR